MSASVLAQLTLGYRLLWNRRREIAALELHVEALPGHGGVDARHLLATLAELWPARAPQLLLSIRSPALLHELLLHAGADSPWVIVPHEALVDPARPLHVAQAHARGLPLVWQGRAGQQPDPALAACFRYGMYSLDDALALPVGQILQAPASRAQAGLALEQRSAWAVAGWPADEVFGWLQTQPPAPDRTAITRLVRAIEDDASMDRIEELFNREPVLGYRFLCHLNSPALQLRGPIDTLQRGLMVLGLANVQSWLLAQLAQAGSEPDLNPVRRSMVLRAQLLEHLLDAGDEEDLRREVFLCGLLSQLHRLLGEPQAQVLERLPLSQRILQALLEHNGPYHPALQLAQSLESAHMRLTRHLCESYGYAQEDVNRALLRTLAALAA